MSGLPTSASEARAANLRRYQRATPGKCGHAGEWDLKQGCLTCRKSKRTRKHAARILSGKWLPALTDAIEAQRAHTLTGRATYFPSDKLALIVAHVVTKPRPDDNLPSPLTVAQEISALELDPLSDGAALLGMAESCGFVVLADAAKKPGTDPKWRPPKEVRLSFEAQAQRASIEAELARSEIAPARPLREVPPLKLADAISKNDDDPAPVPMPADPLPILEALAPIQNTAWRVNPFMLDTLRKLTAFGEALDANQGKHAVSVAALEQAAHYADAPQFFYRCNFDWRGRLYQEGGRLQYTSGTDAARSLLEFAHGEPLTPDGRTWLAVHLATCYGVFGSFRDRHVWTEEHHNEILRAAADPIGSTFWHGAKQPYRCLAACRAWADVAADPRTPVHLPAAADATASIFQHYAWLLRDETLGQLVNLKPGKLSDTPTDLYGSIAQLRTEGGPFTRQEVKAQAWMFYGKRPDARTMGPYALKRANAIQRLLKARAPRAWSLYGALRRTASREAAAGRPLEWTLPDGFRVRQASRKYESEPGPELLLSGWSGTWRLQCRRDVLTDEFDVKANARGLPPNLVHSLDACLLRAIVREAAGVTRWAVAHDSFGVHPNDGGKLRAAMAEAVDCLYGPDLLASLGLGCEGVEHPANLPESMRGGWYTLS